MGAPDVEAQLAELAETGDGDRAFELGLHYVTEHDDLQTAERFYRVAIEAGEENSYNNLARILGKQGRDAEAEELYRHAIDLGDHVAVTNFAAFLDQRDRDEEAIALLREHADHDTEIAERLARRHYSRDEWSDAERWFRVAAEDDRPAAVTCVGMLLEARGERDEAERWLRRGAELGDPHAPEHLAAHYDG